MASNLLNKLIKIDFENNFQHSKDQKKELRLAKAEKLESISKIMKNCEKIIPINKILKARTTFSIIIGNTPFESS